MNYKIVKKIISIFIASSLLTSCGKPSSTTYNKNSDITVAEDSSTNTEPIDKNHPELTAYKDLISDTLQETSDSDLRVARINLDNDDIYELAIFEGDAHNQGAYLYTYKDGDVISLNNDDFPFYGQYGGFSYNPKNKKLHYDYDSANKSVEFYFTFENASLNLDYFLSHDINSDDVDNIEEHFYYVNDDIVSRKEFNQVADDMHSDCYSSDVVYLYYGDCCEVSTTDDIDYALSISLPLAKDEDDTENVPESDDDILESIEKENYDSYKKAYEAVINYESNSNSEDLEYDFIYIDSDDIPELVVGKNGYYLWVYTFLNGHISLALPFSSYGVGGCVHFEYAPYKNCIRSFGQGEKTVGHTLYELKDSEINKIFSEEASRESADVIYINYTGNHLTHADIQKIYNDTCNSYEFEYMGGGYSAAEALAILQK